MQKHLLIALIVSLTTVPIVSADGMLDRGFGNGGMVMTNFGHAPGFFSPDVGHALIVQPDGRAVVGGSSEYSELLALARYLPSGALDPEFGNAGKVEFGCPNALAPDVGAKALLLQPDGQLVVFGNCPNFGLPQSTLFRVSRLGPYGVLDGSFGAQGTVQTPFPKSAWITAGVLQPDGRIIAVGNMGSLQAPTIVAARYNADGSLDSSFGAAGRLILPLARPFAASDAALQADGKLVIAGAYGPSGSLDFGLVRLLPSGAPDPSFDGDGLVSADFGGEERGTSLIVLEDGRLVVGGSRNSHVALARYLEDGAVDETFGTGGLATADSGTPDGAVGVVVLPNGNLIAAGTRGPGGAEDFFLARFLPDGALDTSFGSHGFLSADFGSDAIPSRDFCAAVVLAPHDRVLAAGMVFQPVMNSLTPDFGVTRYITTESLAADR